MLRFYLISWSLRELNIFIITSAKSSITKSGVLKLRANYRGWFASYSGRSQFDLLSVGLPRWAWLSNLSFTICVKQMKKRRQTFFRWETQITLPLSLDAVVLMSRRINIGCSTRIILTLTKPWSTFPCNNVRLVHVKDSSATYEEINVCSIQLCLIYFASWMKLLQKVGISWVRLPHCNYVTRGNPALCACVSAFEGILNKAVYLERTLDLPTLRTYCCYCDSRVAACYRIVQSL
jgi:hypothetical protein